MLSPEVQSLSASCRQHCRTFACRRARGCALRAHGRRSTTLPSPTPTARGYMAAVLQCGSRSQTWMSCCSELIQSTNACGSSATCQRGRHARRRRASRGMACVRSGLPSTLRRWRLTGLMMRCGRPLAATDVWCSSRGVPEDMQPTRWVNRRRLTLRHMLRRRRAVQRRRRSPWRQRRAAMPPAGATLQQARSQGRVHPRPLIVYHVAGCSLSWPSTAGSYTRPHASVSSPATPFYARCARGSVSSTATPSREAMCRWRC